MKRQTASQKKGDWRDEIMNDLPQTTENLWCRSYADALEVIRIAAYNRRMHVADFVARAALAVAVYDSQGELDYHKISEKEPAMRDLRRRGMRLRRLRGNGFGPWIIKEMGE